MQSAHIPVSIREDSGSTFVAEYRSLNYKVDSFNEVENMLLHGVVTGSRVNGPGVRAVVYFQGCSLGCPQCWNPKTHRFSGAERGVAEIVDCVVRSHGARPLDGVTFSGGEPMQI